MQIVTSLYDPIVSEVLLKGQSIVAPTDTIFGILARAESPEAVENLYQTRGRSPNKPSIVLVGNINDIPELNLEQRQTYLRLSQQRPTTIVTKVSISFLPHLPKYLDTLAFRVVGRQDLAELIEKTGPLIAPSANKEGQKPAVDIASAIDYFGDNVAVYVDEQKPATAQASRIVAIENGSLKIIRE